MLRKGYLEVFGAAVTAAVAMTTERCGMAGSDGPENLPVMGRQTMGLRELRQSRP